MTHYRIDRAAGVACPWRILLIGARGQIGGELAASLKLLGEVIPASRSRGPSNYARKMLSVDLADPDGVRNLVRSVGPQLIVNAAGLTAVDEAEADPELAMAVNGVAPGILAEEAVRCGAALIHYSSHDVYDGSGAAPWRETDPVGPISAYGRSKLAGDLAIEATGAPHLILRTSWVYGSTGRNFVKTLLGQGVGQTRPDIADDAIGAPTSARVIAEATAHIIVQAGRELTGSFRAGGVVHIACQGETSTRGYAQEVLRLAARSGFAPATSGSVLPEDFTRHAAAPRPRNCRLNCHSLWDRFAVQLPAWNVVLRDEFPALLHAWKEELARQAQPPAHFLPYEKIRRVPSVVQ